MKKGSIKVKTSELTGAALDWAVAKCTYGDAKTANGKPMFIINFGYVLHHTHKNGWKLSHASLFNPSADWSQGGPIIEREKIDLASPNPIDPNWCAMQWRFAHGMKGPTPLIAAMRCYVASKLGEEVEVPVELL